VIQLDPSKQWEGDFFSIVGTFAGDGKFVFHVAILDTNSKFIRGERVRVCHMCPPLHLGEAAPNVAHPRAVADLIGVIEDLTEGEKAGMLTWLADISTRVQPVKFDPSNWKDVYLNQYILCPPMRGEQIDQVTSIPRFYRFSCVGFVLECYRVGANINLLAWDSPDFPKIDISELIPIYTDRALLHPRNRRKIGLTGQGPWPIALPGYVFHSLARSNQEVRSKAYLPSSKDEVKYP
jgi:hypothetical protein